MRFNRATEGTSSGNIVHSSAGATDRNQAVTGTAADPSADPITFTGEELLGRPTDTSMSIKVVPDEDISLYYEYGTTSGVYTQQTATETADRRSAEDDGDQRPRRRTPATTTA